MWLPNRSRTSEEKLIIFGDGLSHRRRLDRYRGGGTGPSVGWEAKDRKEVEVMMGGEEFKRKKKRKGGLFDSVSFPPFAFCIEKEGHFCSEELPRREKGRTVHLLQQETTNLSERKKIQNSKSISVIVTFSSFSVHLQLHTHHPTPSQPIPNHSQHPYHHTVPAKTHVSIV